jgi:hypothetical protein
MEGSSGGRVGIGFCVFVDEIADVFLLFGVELSD